MQLLVLESLLCQSLVCRCDCPGIGLGRNDLTLVLVIHVALIRMALIHMALILIVHLDLYFKIFLVLLVCL